MSENLGEFFSLIGKAKKEKEDEFRSLVGDLDIDSMFSQVKDSIKEDKKKKKKEEKQLKALESWLFTEAQLQEKTKEVVKSSVIGVDETEYEKWIEDKWDEEEVSSEIVEETEEEVSSEIVEETEETEEEEVEDTVDHALKILETIKSKEEVRENLEDPEILKIRRELEYLKNLVNAQGGGGEVRLEFLDDVDRDSVKVDGKFLKYQASTGKFIGADASGGGGGGGDSDYASSAGIATFATTAGVSTNSTKLNDQVASYYLDYDNFTNTPTIPTNNNQLTNGAGYITTSFTNTNQLTNGAGFITASDNITGTAAGLSGSPNITIGIVTATSIIVGSAVTINSSGLDITGVATASSFVKSGGTSSQFLKADGSVDSNTYLTSYTETDTLDNVTSRGNSTSNGISVGVVTATALHTGAEGSAIRVTSDTISGPANLIIDPAGVGDNTGIVRVKGDLYVDGTEFTVNSSTIELADLKVGIATTVGTNLLLDGGGIGIGSTSVEKTILWNNSSTSLKSSENWDLASGKVFKINGTEVLSATSLTITNVNASGIVTAARFSGSGSSLTSIPNGSLDNSSVSYGGVSLNLGETDATPAFDLSDATNYPFASLTGISTDIVGDTSPQLGGNLDLNSNNITGTGDIDFTGSLTVTSTDTGSSAAPELTLYRNSASPAPGDYLGQIMFKGENSNGGQENYAKITGKITDETLGTEDGLIETAIKGNGSFTIVSRQRSDELQLINGCGLSVDGDISGDLTGNVTGDVNAGIVTSSTVVLTNGLITTVSSTTTATDQTSIDSFSASTYRSAKYNVQITRGSEYQTTEISVIHDGSGSYGTEYATIKTGTLLATFSTDVSGGNVRLLATPSSATSTVFKLFRTTTEV